MKSGRRTRGITGAALVLLIGFTSTHPADAAGPSGPREVVAGTAAAGPAPVGSATIGPAVLDGYFVSIAVPKPADASIVKLDVEYSALGGQSQTTTLVPGTTWNARVDQLYTTYTYVVMGENAAGERGPSSTFQLVPLERPVMSAADPTSNASPASPFRVFVRGSARNDATTRYSVDWRAVDTGSWTRWLTLDSLITRVFGMQAETGVARTSSVPGTTYEFRGQAIDPYGNATAPVVSTRAVVPYDQNRLAFTGSTITVARTGAYGGTSAFLRTAGATAAVALPSDRVQVIGERCPTCGAFDVYLDGVRKTRVDSYASTRSVRQVLWSSPGQYSDRARALSVRAVGTAGRPTVVVDALAVRRFALPSGAAIVSGQQLRNNIGSDSLITRDRSYSADVDSGQLVVQRIFSLDGPTVDYETVYAAGKGGSRLTVQHDGNVVLYDAAGKGVFQTATGGNGTVALVMQNDGNLVVYRLIDGKPLWSTKTGRAY